MGSLASIAASRVARFLARAGRVSPSATRRPAGSGPCPWPSRCASTTKSTGPWSGQSSSLATREPLARGTVRGRSRPRAPRRGRAEHDGDRVYAVIRDIVVDATTSMSQPKCGVASGLLDFADAHGPWRGSGPRPAEKSSKLSNSGGFAVRVELEAAPIPPQGPVKQPSNGIPARTGATLSLPVGYHPKPVAAGCGADAAGSHGRAGEARSVPKCDFAGRFASERPDRNGAGTRVVSAVCNCVAGTFRPGRGLADRGASAGGRK